MIYTEVVRLVVADRVSEEVKSLALVCLSVCLLYARLFNSSFLTSGPSTVIFASNLHASLQRDNHASAPPLKFTDRKLSS